MWHRDTMEGVLHDITQRLDRLRSAWSDCRGWAPDEAADLLAKARLDRIVSLGHTLRLWIEPATPEDEQGRLVLAWANLGAIVEGLMKTFLSVYVLSYERDIRTKAASGKLKVMLRKGRPQSVDSLKLDQLRRFFEEVIIVSDKPTWTEWIERVQSRRNSIHAFQDREIGSFDEFEDDIWQLREFVDLIEGRLPPTPEPHWYT